MAAKPIENFSLSMLATFFLLFIWATITSIPKMLYNTVKKIFPTKEKDLTGKIVLVTGSGMGLGKEMATRFAVKGARVICVDINEKANEITCKEINKFADSDKKAKAYTCDVSDIQAIENLKESVLKDFGHVDILVSNAGLIYGKPILEEDADMVRKVIEVNQMSSYWMVRSFLPHMEKRKEGHFVFINSIASLSVMGDAMIYCMTKYALLGMALSLADYFNRNAKYSNIKISTVHPYFIATPGLKAEMRSQNIRALTTESAAKQIVTGVQREYFQFIVPGYEIGYKILSLSWALPTEINKKIIQALNDWIVGDAGKLHKN